MFALSTKRSFRACTITSVCGISQSYTKEPEAQLCLAARSCRLTTLMHSFMNKVRAYSCKNAHIHSACVDWHKNCHITHVMIVALRHAATSSQTSSSHVNDSMKVQRQGGSSDLETPLSDLHCFLAVHSPGAGHEGQELC